MATLWLCGLALLPVMAMSSSPSVHSPSSRPPLDAAARDALYQRLQEIAVAVHDDFDGDALGVAVWFEGEPLLTHAFGGDDDTLFQLASASKTFASRIVLEAVRRGADLDAHISSPELLGSTFHGVAPTVGRQSDPTLRSLLSMRGGVGVDAEVEGFMLGEDSAEYDPTALDDHAFLDFMQHGSVAVVPSGRSSFDYMYSNIGLHLATVVAADYLRRAGHISCDDSSARCWEHAVEQIIFEPLSMHGSRTSLAQLRDGDDVAANLVGGSTGVPHHKKVRLSRSNIRNVGSAGSILSSASDMQQWLGWWASAQDEAALFSRNQTDAAAQPMAFNTGGQCAVDAHEIAIQRCAQTATASGPCTGDYTLGLIDQTWPWNTNLKYKYHNGKIAGTGSLVGFDAERGWGVAVLSHRENFASFIPGPQDTEALFRAVVGEIYVALGEDAQPRGPCGPSQDVNLYWTWRGSTDPVVSRFIQPWMEQFVNGIPGLHLSETGISVQHGTMEESVAAWENVKQVLEPLIIREHPTEGRAALYEGTYCGWNGPSLPINLTISAEPRPHCQEDADEYGFWDGEVLRAHGLGLVPDLSLLGLVMRDIVPCKDGSDSVEQMARDIGAVSFELRHCGFTGDSPDQFCAWSKYNKLGIGERVLAFSDFVPGHGPQSVSYTFEGRATTLRACDGPAPPAADDNTVFDDDVGQREVAPTRGTQLRGASASTADLAFASLIRHTAKSLITPSPVAEHGWALRTAPEAA